MLCLKSFPYLSLFFPLPKRHFSVVWCLALFITWGFFSFLFFFLGKPLVNKTVILSLLHDKYMAKKSLNLKMSRPFWCTHTLAIEIIHAKLIIIVSYLHDRIQCLCKEVNWNTPWQISLIFHQIWSSKSTVFSQIVYEIIYATFLAINVWSSPSQKNTKLPVAKSSVYSKVILETPLSCLSEDYKKRRRRRIRILLQ